MNLDLLKDWKSRVVEQCQHKKVSFRAGEIDRSKGDYAVMDKFCQDMHWDEINRGWFEHDQTEAKRMLSFTMSGNFANDIITLAVHETYPAAEQLVDMFGQDTTIYCNALLHLTQKPYLRAWCGLTDADITTAFAFVQNNMIYVLLLEE